MTLKNTDKFRVLVTNHQVIDGDEDIISETGTGSVRRADDVWYITYKVDGMTVMVKVSGDTAHVRRTGEYGSDIKYIKGETTTFSYRTPYGIMDMQLYTEDIKCSMSLFGGVIILEYLLFTGSGRIENKMEIKIAAI